MDKKQDQCFKKNDENKEIACMSDFLAPERDLFSEEFSDLYSESDNLDYLF